MRQRIPCAISSAMSKDGSMGRSPASFFGLGPKMCAGKYKRGRLLTRAFPESLPDPALIAIERAVSEAETYASKEQVLHNRFLSPRALRDHITSNEKSLVLAHQQESLEPFDFQSLSVSLEHQLHDRMQLWWAGKELASGKRLCDYIGPNEKTKIIIRLKPSPTKA